jgi:DNA-binding transcriptional MocR family regulator
LAGCGLLDSGGGLNPFTSAMVYSIIENGRLEANIARLVSVYRSKVRAMEAGLQKYLPGVSYSLPQGGYFFWVRLPKGVGAADLRRRAGSHQVDFREGARFSSRGGLQEYLRLCYIYYDEGEIEQGLARLGKCLSG